MPPATLQVLLADDELLARRRLARLLAELPGVALVGECSSGQELLATLARGDEEHHLQLLELYIQQCAVELLIVDEVEHITQPPCLLYTSPSPRDRTRSRMPSSA